jgi:hypothetical protein
MGGVATVLTFCAQCDSERFRLGASALVRRGRLERQGRKEFGDCFGHIAVVSIRCSTRGLSAAPSGARGATATARHWPRKLSAARAAAERRLMIVEEREQEPARPPSARPHRVGLLHSPGGLGSASGLPACLLSRGWGFSLSGSLSRAHARGSRGTETVWRRRIVAEAMPYSNPERQRAAKAESARRRRAARMEPSRAKAAGVDAETAPPRGERLRRSGRRLPRPGGWLRPAKRRPDRSLLAHLLDRAFGPEGSWRFRYRFGGAVGRSGTGSAPCCRLKLATV